MQTHVYYVAHLFLLKRTLDPLLLLNLKHTVFDVLVLQVFYYNKAEMIADQKAQLEADLALDLSEPWQQLNTRWDDYANEYGEGWVNPGLDYEAELWETIQGGYGG